MINEEYRELYMKSDIKNYINGKYTSKSYTNEEIQQKREYYENQLPAEKLKISKNRWLFEVERRFEKYKYFSEYPDSTFARLDFILKYGF